MKTYFDNIEAAIINNLTNADKDIKIAVAWFNNLNIFNCLLSLLPNVTVSLIISNDKNNYDNGNDFPKFINAGGFIYLPKTSRLMHNKYVIIDNKTLITGSYNFTMGAEYNDENIIVISESNAVSTYIDNFYSLLKVSFLVKDFNNDINKYELKFLDIINPKSKDEVYSVNNKIIVDDKDFVANSLMEQWWLGHSETRGIAMLSLVEDILHQTDNQKLLIAAYITYLVSGKDLQADRCLKKITHKDKEKYISQIRENIARGMKFGLWLD